MDRRDPVLDELDDRTDRKLKNSFVFIIVLAFIAVEYYILWNL